MDSVFLYWFRLKPSVDFDHFQPGSVKVLIRGFSGPKSGHYFGLMSKLGRNDQIRSGGSKPGLGHRVSLRASSRV